MKRHTGFTLVEVLIAMLVLAVGLLGLAALQVTSLKNNLSAYNRSQATQLAYDLADRMRANVAEAKPAIPPSTYTAISPTAAVAHADCLTVSTTCTIADMAENDLYEWNCAVAGGCASIKATLPSGVGSVCLDSSPAAPACDGLGDTYAIEIWWHDDRSGTALQRFVVSFQL